MALLSMLTSHVVRTLCAAGETFKAFLDAALRMESATKHFQQYAAPTGSTTFLSNDLATMSTGFQSELAVVGFALRLRIPQGSIRGTPLRGQDLIALGVVAAANVKGASTLPKAALPLIEAGTVFAHERYSVISTVTVWSAPQGQPGGVDISTVLNVHTPTNGSHEMESGSDGKYGEFLGVTPQPPPAAPKLSRMLHSSFPPGVGQYKRSDTEVNMPPQVPVGIKTPKNATHSPTAGLIFDIMPLAVIAPVISTMSVDKSSFRCVQLQHSSSQQ